MPNDLQQMHLKLFQKKKKKKKIQKATEITGKNYESL